MSGDGSEVRVRGRDFTGYRIGGAIAAALLFLALVVQGWELFDGDARTVPEVAWSAAGDAGGESILTDEILRDRTRLQSQRFRSGPSPDGTAETFKVGDAILLGNRAIDDEDAMLTEIWRLPDDESGSLLRGSERIIGISSLPYANAALFERPFARDWRLGLADVVTHVGAFAILGFSFLLALVLAVRGRVPIAKGRTDRTVKRFGLLERANHWLTAVSFIMLALTGITIAYGRTLILPFGEELLGSLGWLATWGHAMFFPPFALGLTAMILLWTVRNLPSRLDIEWLRRAGGFFSDDPDNPPARKFNAGQKLVYWSAVIGGLLMIATGIFLMFPFWFADLQTMSWIMLTHALIAVFLIAIFIGHIYIGTVGMQGAFWAMWTGDVDRNWAEEHHELWMHELDKGR
ncbi:formate dehydrogenase subunit gamma [Rhodobacteraceae bacterium 2CG4]|uniref:Formate dehydrogenase subunit gamma n=1 Tax=Halovulum marinum TaxID=2662447 RepID=A0A6L5Z136_9RHOB|nr:formate dehydrogenase subunit gamma [Halovulum marinum]MSU90283.1 formate dehydrogenase subunit gamma [Halovulum marinum]